MFVRLDVFTTRIYNKAWKVFFFVCVNIFIMKNVFDFGKTVEIGVDPRLVAVKLHVV